MPSFAASRPVQALDRHLFDLPSRPTLRGLPRFLLEFVYFGIKEARACLFVGLFFAAVFTVPHAGFLEHPALRSTVDHCHRHSDLDGMERFGDSG